MNKVSLESSPQGERRYAGVERRYGSCDADFTDPGYSSRRFLLLYIYIPACDMSEPADLPEEMLATLATDGEQLLEQLRLLEQLPQVRLVPSSVFDRAKPPVGGTGSRRALQADMLQEADRPEVQRPHGRYSVPHSRRGGDEASAEGAGEARL